jgi:hypothetical protein
MLKPVSLNLVSTCSVVLSGVNPRQTTSEFLGVLPRQTSACIFSSPYTNYIINKNKHILPKKTLRTLYYALVHPHLLYCLPIYGCTTKKNLNKLIVAQKKTIRAICNAKYNEHTKPLFTEINILPYEQLLLQSKSLLMHSVIHKYSPSILHDEWLLNINRNHGIELRNIEDIYVPRATSDQVKRLPWIELANIWNNLPPDKLHSNPITFKIQLNNYIWDCLN